MSKIKVTDNTRTEKKRCYDNGFYKSDCYLVMSTDCLNTPRSSTFKGVVVALLSEGVFLAYSRGDTSDTWNKSDFEPVDVEITLHSSGTL